MAALKRVAIISASTRSRRLGPSVARYVQGIAAPKCPNATLDLVDLADQNLPLFDEIDMPGSHPADDPTPHYNHEHTRKWSAVVRQYDGFIFVTPQYNWSIPASLKSALDFLFHEWGGKPAGVVSYGGRGGGKAAAHLRDVLTGLRMKVIAADHTPSLTTSGKMMPYILEHKQVSETDVERWKEQGSDMQIETLAREISEALADKTQ